MDSKARQSLIILLAANELVAIATAEISNAQSAWGDGTPTINDERRNYHTNRAIGFINRLQS